MLSFFVYLSLLISVFLLFLIVLQYCIDKQYREEVNVFFKDYPYSQLMFLVLFFIPFVNAYLLFLEICTFIEFLQEKK